MTRHQTGLTLIELLIVIAVIGVLLGIALPSYNGYMEAARSSAAKSSLLASLTTTASRAALASSHAVLCASEDGRACSGKLNWSRGWIGFLDHNGNRARDPDELQFVTEGPLDGDVRLHSTKGRTRIVFQPNGGNAGSNVTFTLCDGRGEARAQTLVINNAGGMRYGTPSAKAVAGACAKG